MQKNASLLCDERTCAHTTAVLTAGGLFCVKRREMPTDLAMSLRPDLSDCKVMLAVMQEGGQMLGEEVPMAAFLEPPDSCIWRMWGVGRGRRRES
jgi:hypothetical protein